MKKSKIVCTIGPASETVEQLVQLINAGMNVARLNFSHGDHQEHLARIINIREAAKQTGKTVGIMLDNKGPEIRTGDLETEFVEISTGNQLVIAMDELPGNEDRISVSYAGLINDIHVGSTILLDDGLIELEVTDIQDGEIITQVLNNGILKSHKGVNVPNVSLDLPGITEKDAGDIRFGIEQGIDFIAASFIRSASDVLEIREFLEEHGAGDIHIIPKIENREGVDNTEEILNVSDGLMVARGDLGVEIPAEEVPIVQKQLIRQCNIHGKPVITATHMLDSMQRNPVPSRAEANDVANAIFDGSDCVMLSGETAAGDYPVEAVMTMDRIARRSEQVLDFRELFENRSKDSDTTITDAISQSVANSALNLDVSAIVTATESGNTARMIAKYRPEASIVAVTHSEEVCRRLTLVWGVIPQMGKVASSTDEMLEIAIEGSLQSGVVHHGDLVVISAGVPVGESGTTNLMKVHVVGDVFAKGQGVGRKSASGKVVTAFGTEEVLSKMTEGSILVANATDIDMMPAVEKAAALVTEKGGLTSHAAIVGLSLGIPVIVGVKGASDLFKDGQEITVDSARGDIYNGHASVL